MENNNCKEEISFENLLLQSEGERYSYPEVFTDDCGLDIEFPEKGMHAVKSWGYTKRNQKRRATLRIDSYIGFCSEAKHYYGKIEIINNTENNRDDLMQDFVSIITSFTARLYGQRRTKRKTEKLIEILENEVS